MTACPFCGKSDCRNGRCQTTARVPTSARMPVTPVPTPMPAHGNTERVRSLVHTTLPGACGKIILNGTHICIREKGHPPVPECASQFFHNDSCCEICAPHSMRMQGHRCSDHMEQLDAVLCEHANEVPAVCPCPETCYCKTHTCAQLKRRAEDQPLPVKNGNPSIQDLVIADMEARKAIGLKRYGTLLQAGNGRDFLKDTYEELLDACNYIRGVMYERDGK
jgi:hypothetical protein